jgi:predicted GTPase
VNVCIRTVEKPDDRSIVHNVDAGLHQAVHAHCDAFKQALSESGQEIRTYEMNLALAASLTDNAPRKRYERRKQAFAAALAAG